MCNHDSVSRSLHILSLPIFPWGFDLIMVPLRKKLRLAARKQRLIVLSKHLEKVLCVRNIETISIVFLSSYIMKVVYDLDRNYQKTYRPGSHTSKK